MNVKYNLRHLLSLILKGSTLSGKRKGGCYWKIHVFTLAYISKHPSIVYRGSSIAESIDRTHAL
jgi:hypothetical protein